MLTTDGRLVIAGADDRLLEILPAMANRHGLITGATGTGKTISLQVIAESFSAAGIPVFITDIKGDVSGIAQAGTDSERIRERVGTLGLEQHGFSFHGCPVCFWDIFASAGLPLRTTVSEMGPVLISRLLDLNATQSAVMQILFRFADDNGLLLLDFKDLQSIVAFASDKENRAALSREYGAVASASIAAVQRALLGLEEQGAELFFGEPGLDIRDLLRTAPDGKGVVNLLAAGQLMQNPQAYAAFLLWVLSELHEQLPEAGDRDKPKLALFFDEAHLIFSNMPPVLLQTIESVVRLIRSKGVGVYFISQNPADIPERVLAQLGNRVQHALRAYTPKEQKAVRAAASSFRPNPAFKTEEAITSLGVGEALVSCLDADGVPGVVERAMMLPPASRIGPLDEAERLILQRQSPLREKYAEETDRESAYEKLTARVMEHAAQEEEEAARKKREKAGPGFAGALFADVAKKTKSSITRNIANALGRSIIRGILGGIFGGK